MSEYEVVNVVGMVTYRQKFALDALANTFSNREEIASVTYEPAENHWLQTRFEPDETYVAFYRTGRCSVAGCNSIEHFYEVVERVNKVMCDLLEFDYEPDAEISNIVATAELGTTIPLEVLALELGMDTVEYEPEQFPALMYRGSNHVMLVFASGKLLCTGLTDLDEVSVSIEKMKTRIDGIV